MQIKTWIINFFLLVTVIVCSIGTYRLWNKPLEWQPQGGLPKQKAMKTVQVYTNRQLPESSFRTIEDQNLFSRDRKLHVPAAPQEQKEADQSLMPTAQTKPEETIIRINGRPILLYGVVMAGNDKRALITNPFSGNQNRREIWIKPKQIIEDYRVHDIRPNAILLRKENKLYEISLFDKQKTRPTRSPRTVVKTEAPRVVHTGSSATDPKNTAAGAKQNENGKPERVTVMTPFGPVDAIKK